MTGGFGDGILSLLPFRQSDQRAPGGVLTVSGIPERYRPAQRYVITVELTRAETQEGGFEIAARFQNGPEGGGQQAGLWRALDRRVQLQSSRDGRLQFGASP